MTAHRAIEVRNGAYRAVASLNGRTRCNIYVYFGEGDDAALLLNGFDINPADDRARARSAGQLAEEHRSAVSQLLLEVAQAADIERTKPASKKGTDIEAVFPPIEPWPEPVDPVALLDGIVALVAAHVIVPPHALTAIALWVCHTYVADVVEGMIAAMNHIDRCAGEIFNLGAETSITTREAIQAAETLIGRPARVVIRPKRPGEQWRTHANIAKARQWLGYAPKHSLHEGLALQIDWYRSQIQGNIRLW